MRVSYGTCRARRSRLETRDSSARSRVKTRLSRDESRLSKSSRASALRLRTLHVKWLLFTLYARVLKTMCVIRKVTVPDVLAALLLASLDGGSATHPHHRPLASPAHRRSARGFSRPRRPKARARSLDPCIPCIQVGDCRPAVPARAKSTPRRRSPRSAWVACRWGSGNALTTSPHSVQGVHSVCTASDWR